MGFPPSSAYPQRALSAPAEQPLGLEEMRDRLAAIEAELQRQTQERKSALDPQRWKTATEARRCMRPTLRNRKAWKELALLKLAEPTPSPTGRMLYDVNEINRRIDAWMAHAASRQEGLSRRTSTKPAAKTTLAMFNKVA